MCQMGETRGCRLETGGPCPDPVRSEDEDDDEEEDDSMVRGPLFPGLAWVAPGVLFLKLETSKRRNDHVCDEPNRAFPGRYHKGEG